MNGSPPIHCSAIHLASEDGGIATSSLSCAGCGGSVHLYNIEKRIEEQ